VTSDGWLARPLPLSYEEVRTLRRRAPHLTLVRVSDPTGGRYLGNASWRGTRLLPLGEPVRIRPEAV